MEQEIKHRATWSDPQKAFLSYLAQAEDLDRSWSERGLCRRYKVNDGTDAWKNWMADYYEANKRPSRTQREQTARAQAALMICANCPVQYDCAFYGAATNSVAGIWGVRTRNLDYLRGYGIDHGQDALASLMDQGRAVERNVDVFTTRVRIGAGR